MPNYGHHAPFAYNLPVLTYKNEHDTRQQSSVLGETAYQEHPQYQHALVQNLAYLYQHQQLRRQQQQEQQQQQQKYFQHFFHHHHQRQQQQQPAQHQASSYQSYSNFYLPQAQTSTTQLINDASFAPPAYTLPNYNQLHLVDMKKRQLTAEEENLIRLELEQQRRYLRSLYAQQLTQSQMLPSQQQQQPQPGIFRPFQVLQSNTLEPQLQPKSKVQHIFKPVPIERSRQIIDNASLQSPVTPKRQIHLQDRSSQFNSITHSAPQINTQLPQTAQYTHSGTFEELTFIKSDITTEAPTRPIVTSALSAIPIATKETIFTTLKPGKPIKREVEAKIDIVSALPHHLLRLPSLAKSQNPIAKVPKPIAKVPTPPPPKQSPKIVKTYDEAKQAKMSQELMQIMESCADDSDDDDSSFEFNSNELPVFDVQVNQITPFWPKPLRKPVLVESLLPVKETLNETVTKLEKSQREYVNLFDRVNFMLKQFNDRYSEPGPLSSTKEFTSSNTKPKEERVIKKAVRRTIATGQTIDVKPISSMQKAPSETELDSVLRIYPKREERENGIVYVLGPNGTTVTAAQFNEVHWTTAPVATRFLLLMVFTSDELATHTLTGKPSPAFYGRERPAKLQMDPQRVEDIIVCVRNRTGGKERHIRATITTKCAETAKKYKRRALVAAAKQAKRAVVADLQSVDQSEEVDID